MKRRLQLYKQHKILWPFPPRVRCGSWRKEENVQKVLNFSYIIINSFNPKVFLQSQREYFASLICSLIRSNNVKSDRQHKTDDKTSFLFVENISCLIWCCVKFCTATEESKFWFVETVTAQREAPLQIEYSCTWFAACTFFFQDTFLKPVKHIV